jgi:hypothetical protein
MKTHAINENKITRTFEMVFFVAFLSTLTVIISESGNLFTAFRMQSNPEVYFEAELPVVNNALRSETTPSPVHPSGVEEASVQVSALPAASAISSSGLMDVYLVPVAEHELMLEDWMVRDDYWTIPQESSGGLSDVAENSAEMLAGAGSAKVTPASVMQYLVPVAEPAIGLDTWMTGDEMWQYTGNTDMALEMPLNISTSPNFDCLAYLKNIIRIREALVEEPEPTLKLEPWMTDAGFFRTASNPGPRTP